MLRYSKYFKNNIVRVVRLCILGTHLGSARSIECRTRPQYVLRLKRDSGRSRRPGREDVMVMNDCFFARVYSRQHLCFGVTVRHNSERQVGYRIALLG